MIHKSQRGLTLVELVIVVALAGLVGAAITATAFQVFAFNTRLYNQMTAVRQVQQAGFWVSPDVMMAQNVTPGGSPTAFLTLNWTVNGINYGVIYSLEGAGTLKTLQRKYYVNSNLTSTTTVAEYISYPTGTSIVPNQPCSSPNCSAYNFTVTATVGGQNETRVYEVKPRPGT